MIFETVRRVPVGALRRSTQATHSSHFRPDGGLESGRLSRPPDRRTPDWLGRQHGIRSCCHRPGITPDKVTQQRSDEC